MITELIFTRLPRLFSRLGRVIRASMCYRAVAALWHALCRAASSSLIGRALGEHKNEGRVYERSLLFAALDALARFFVRLFSRVISALTFGRNSSLFIDAGRWLLSAYRFVDFEFFIGLCLGVMFLCPGTLWHNTYGLAIACVLLALLFVQTAIGARPVLKFRVLGAPFLLFFASSLIGVGTASNRSDAIRVLIFFITAFIFCVVIAADITDEVKLKKLLGAIYLCVICTAAVAFVQRAMGVEISASLTDVSQNSSMPGRVYSTFDNPNNYAEFLVLTVPLAFAYCTMLRNSALKRLSVLLLALPLGALLMTYSRSGWISFALACFVLVFFLDKRLLPLFALVCVCAVPLLPASVYNRILTIGSTADSSNMYRVYIWRAVTDMLRDHWATGVGLGPASFRTIYLQYCAPIARPAPHSHMLFLEIWCEFGIVGIVCYISMLFTALRRSILALKLASRNVRTALIACVAALTGIMFASAAEYIWYYPRVLMTYFIVVGISMAAVNIARSAHTAPSKEL